MARPKTKVSKRELHELSLSYLIAHCAARDAKAMIDLGLSEATRFKREGLAAIRNNKLAELDDVIFVVATKEAYDLLELYSHCDGEEGRTATSALTAALSSARARYRRGRCAWCGGPALPCARRHAEGRSCA